MVYTVVPQSIRHTTNVSVYTILKRSRYDVPNQKCGNNKFNGCETLRTFTFIRNTTTCPTCPMGEEKCQHNLHAFSKYVISIEVNAPNDYKTRMTDMI